MTQRETTKAVKAAMKKLGLYGRDTYTVGELEAIAKEARVPMFEVMYVARYY